VFWLCAQPSWLVAELFSEDSQVGLPGNGADPAAASIRGKHQVRSLKAKQDGATCRKASWLDSSSTGSQHTSICMLRRSRVVREVKASECGMCSASCRMMAA